MKPQFTIDDIVKDLCLTVKRVDDLPDNCGGFLDPSPEPRFIAVNARHSYSEQVVTIAHELGHYALHPGNKTRLQSHWLVNQHGSFSRQLRWVIPKLFTREDEADLWGMCLLLAIGANKELNAFIKAHPEKTKWYCLALLGIYINNLPNLPFLWLKVLFGVHVTHEK